MFIASLTFSCSTIDKIFNKTQVQEKEYVEINDGLSYDNAIVISEKNDYRGVNAEYKWLRENYPTYKLKNQSISFYNNKPYDIITIKTKEGEQRNIYFDISSFFGNL